MGSRVKNKTLKTAWRSQNSQLCFYKNRAVTEPLPRIPRSMKISQLAFVVRSPKLRQTYRLSDPTVHRVCPFHWKIRVDNHAPKSFCLPEEAQTILHSLASKWSDVSDSKDLEVIPLTGAMTNEIYQIHWRTNGNGIVPRKVLVRIYGKGVEVFFNRKEEIKTFQCISEKGQGPLLLDRFANGRVEEFIHAKTLSAADLRDPEISALIAAKLREFHDLKMPFSNNVHLWDRLRKWLHEAVKLCPSEEATEFCLASMEDEIDFLKDKLSRENQRIGFCHNDLQYGNIMIDEETRAITIIDYEYAGYNPVAFDLANHFCEMAADYHTETPHILDYDKYPDFEERKRFVQIYLNSSGNVASDVDVELLVEDAEKYVLASHLLWGLWGIISEHVNSIDFDYLEYARQRFDQYRLGKSVLL